MQKRHRNAGIAGLVALTAALLSSGASAEWGLNMRRGVTDISGEIFTLHMAIFYITCIIGVLVFGTMIWAMFKYRKSRGVKPATWHENTRLEVMWTVVPLLILVGMAVPATITLANIYDTPEAEVTVRIDGYQWRWEYTHLANDGEEAYSHFSNLSTPQSQISNQLDKGENYLLEVDEPLRLPADTPIRFLITSQDVIHSWWVPDFGIKRDAIPGIVNEVHTTVPEPGTYRGMCTELCGARHAYMPVVVEVIPPEEYEAWLAEQSGDTAALSAPDNTELTTARQ